ncbi:16S rRNA (cytidine(1402)-2'-O)-methyltransferase [Listeria newyorkensis]|uniref:Ribosomal RNA small subunit methyltransferase I n=1 Tax=Listeria newyorkensis TaxID=1497681 RepID=A0ABX4XNX0_9LIST|nr:16S rRNA (cytidine(1402)-2'-O)-methyltransferase [Listeria newyorkensis]KGL38828.1 16S rRNA methyltransferase [Listeria newyorkensis]PNP92796.1 16S rRNA (cytidine(1402)-2'-O)-methyltransferase [Listeria newyorkensis]WAO23007.1 16S rRNA (cytidine(1402)-2'-O)-methyltransferase [Listeria newyorkensis]SQC57125.1 Ribosomal RNA small subunit methyltransferase I [Listeria newyorkensis]
MKSQKSFAESGDAKGTLYLVPTPIGNLEDMTMRAIRILQEADLIAAEDTRNTIKLLNHFDIHTKMVSYHEHNKTTRQEELIEKLEAGTTIAVVSDAGMPSISDPGYELVGAAIEAGITVVPLPGANAALTALIASGLAPQPFFFYGFLPRSNKDREEALNQLNLREETWIIYESPHRLKEVLKVMNKILGSTRKIVLCRELTKKYEEFLRGTVEEALEWAKETEIRGEFCVIVEGNEDAPSEDEEIWWATIPIKEHVEKVMDEESVSSKEAIKQVMKTRQLPKREVYQAYHEL